MKKAVISPGKRKPPAIFGPLTEALIPGKVGADVGPTDPRWHRLFGDPKQIGFDLDSGNVLRLFADALSLWFRGENSVLDVAEMVPSNEDIDNILSGDNTNDFESSPK